MILMSPNFEKDLRKPRLNAEAVWEDRSDNLKDSVAGWARKEVAGRLTGPHLEREFKLSTTRAKFCGFLGMGK